MRSERALLLAIAERYVQGVTTRGVKRIVEELCGTDISSTQVPRVARLFPNEASRLRLVSAILMEISDDWQTADKRYVVFEAIEG